MRTESVKCINPIINTNLNLRTGAHYVFLDVPTVWIVWYAVLDSRL